MQVIDSFLDEKSFLKIKSTLMSNEFPWFFNEEKSANDYSLNNYQFVHIFYQNYYPSSQYIDLLFPIIEKINPTSILRIKANLNPRTEKIIEYGYHIDIEKQNCLTCVYYVNSNNGKTIFKNGQEIQSKENRIVIFDAKEIHCGTSCNDQKVRCVLNFNFIK